MVGAARIRRAMLVVCALAAMAVLFYVFMALMARSIHSAHRSVSVSNLHSWGTALSLYAHDHGAYPPDLEELYRLEVVDCCPEATDTLDLSPTRNPDTGWLWSYEYVGALPVDVPEWTILAYLRRGIQPGERLVLYADRARTVEWVTEDELHGCAGAGCRCLRTSYEGVVATCGDALTPERDAELRRFYEIEP